MSFISGIQKDFEMGYFIKENIIPKAVLYLTGEKKDIFNVSNYSTEFWSSSSSSSTISSQDESKVSKDESEDQPTNVIEDEPKDESAV